MVVGGRYELGEELGAGAVGKVYVAYDKRLQRRVAVKLVRRPPQSDTEAKEAYERVRVEAHAAGGLSHRNIATIHDFGEDDEFSWIVMELVEGNSLSGVRLPLPEVTRVMTEILAALAFSHDRGVVHRDIKPANILLTPDRQVKIVDFGIARIGASTRTKIGTMLGTLPYMAPEQLPGDAVDHRADIWSAGVVFYELLTGEKPFPGSPEAVIHGVLYVEPQAPSRVSEATPRAFDAVVARALAKDVEARFQSASAFAEAIRAAADATEFVPPPAEHVPPSKPPETVEPARGIEARFQSAPTFVKAIRATAKAGETVRPPTQRVPPPKGLKTARRWRPSAVLAGFGVILLAAGVVATGALRGGTGVTTDPPGRVPPRQDAPEPPRGEAATGVTTDPPGRVPPRQDVPGPPRGEAATGVTTDPSGRVPPRQDVPEPPHGEAAAGVTTDPSGRVPPRQDAPEPPRGEAAAGVTTDPSERVPPRQDAPEPPRGEAESFIMPMPASVRAGPDTSAPVLRGIGRGTRVRVFAWSGGWLQIGEEEPWGWVHESRVPPSSRRPRQVPR